MRSTVLNIVSSNVLFASTSICGGGAKWPVNLLKANADAPRCVSVSGTCRLAQVTSSNPALKKALAPMDSVTGDSLKWELPSPEFQLWEKLWSP